MRINSFVLLVAMITSAGVRAGDFALPEPTGRFKVGTTSRHLIDLAREESATEDEGDHRELMIQLWYPTDSVEGLKPTRFLDEDNEFVEAVFGPKSSLPAGIPLDKLHDALDAVRTHAFPGAALSEAQKQFPVIVFSHGYGGMRTQSRSLTEELASHGYIVVGIDHTYYCAATRFPDGRLVRFRRPENPDEEQVSFEEEDAKLHKTAAVWAADALFVADKLEEISASSEDEFCRKLDLDRLGICGHSFGGATAGNACHLDHRFKCGINMDGRPYGVAGRKGLSQPFMFLRAEPFEPSPLLLAAAGTTKEQFDHVMEAMDAEIARITESSAHAYVLSVTGTKHLNFSDFPFFADLSPMKSFVVGKIDPGRGARLTNDYALAFFNQHLLGSDSPLLAGPSADHKEVEFSVPASE